MFMLQKYCIAKDNIHFNKNYIDNYHPVFETLDWF